MNDKFDYPLACSPNNSVIVSACAGSGKTWLLVARMVRLLLAGAKPQEILALTFTRKAAQEMRDRLYGLLEQFSQMTDEQLMHELTIRGLDDVEAKKLLPQARALYLKVLMSPQSIVIDTFHGWFGRLLGAAPISAEVQPGFNLREDAKRLQEECMQDWWGDLPADLKKHYDVLLREFGAFETDKFLMGNYSLFKQRGAWTFFLASCKARGISPVEALAQCLPNLSLPNPLEEFWRRPGTKEDLQVMLDCFSNSTATHNKRVPLIQRAIALHAAGQSIAEIADEWQICFYAKSTLTPLEDIAKISSPMQKYLATTGGDPTQIAAIRNAWIDAYEAWFPWKKDQDASAINAAWFAMSEAMLCHMQKTKESMRVRDFDDLEIGVSQLMADPANAAYLQARLDAKYSHILIDEFQDTNPLQWQILRSWLEGYGQDGSRPSVFIVGDPKQSIYRFRRADPRLFTSARKFLESTLQAKYLEKNTTRRNADQINEAVNSIFLMDSVPSSYVFAEQDTDWKAPAEGIADHQFAAKGEAMLLPLIERVEQDQVERTGSALDNPIEDSGLTVGVQQRYWEGQQVSRLIHHVLATRQVIDKKDGKECWRPARASDFILLVKRRAYLPQFERALRESGLAYDSSRLGGLLNTLEIDDLIALLTVLVSPRHDLPLAQVLRSPIFGFTEQQMQKLSSHVGDSYSHIESQGQTQVSWWDALQSSSEAEVQRAARYLERWRGLGEALPVHDLLDLIYQESHLRVSYAVASQNLARAQVLANLDAFLELALNQDGGRYPSLSRFIEEINAMRRGDDDETPDEGDVEAEAEDDIGEVDLDSEMSEEDRHKRVRLMTIHGAKGLEAPFVVMLDANHTEWKAPNRGVLLDWPPDEVSPSHLSLYTAKSLTEGRAAIYAKENEVSENENWNVLYVAMTRAQQGLWISGVQSHIKDGISQKSWYGRALAAGIETLDMTQLGEAPAQEQEKINSSGSEPFQMNHFQLSWDAAKQSHQETIANIESGALAIAKKAKERAQVLEQPDPEILEEGTHFHKLLEFLTTHSGSQVTVPMPSEQELMDWLSIDQARAKKLMERVQSVMSAPSLKPYLTDDEWVQAWNEIDLVSLDGKSFRLDRLVEFDDHLAILDYKLTIPEVGGRTHNKYRAQLNNYKQELGRIRPDKPAKAFLISARGEIAEVN
ncbi:UvrD-helicase domain-containing protein [Polynucleobacter arcticus]|uniref:UvrD-helicase domain-containing protein n=1 Tax=Polynucleobacter arcticus TaxID=1743165 RepID=UPI0020C5FD7B|nr:UvrD-helicase domain-containing protein [Polynucleobacter arcticus]